MRKPMPASRRKKKDDISAILAMVKKIADSQDKLEKSNFDIINRLTKLEAGGSPVTPRDRKRKKNE